MAKKSEYKRGLSLISDPQAYHREVPPGAIEADRLKDIPYQENTQVVGRIMLADHTGKISKFGLFDTLETRDVIVLERIESNGFSMPAYLARTQSNVQMINKVIHYGDIVLLEGIKLHINNEDVFIGEKVVLLSKALGDAYDSNIDLRKRSNLYAYRHLQLMRDPEKVLHFRNCAKVFRTIREFLYQRGYDELNLTLLQESFEAGLSDPFVTHVKEHDRDMFLRLTAELYLRKLMIAGYSKVFEISKSFRNQGVTSDMLPQFTILELYCAYAAREETEDLLRDMIREILIKIYGNAVIPVGDALIDCSGDWFVYDFKEEIMKSTGLIYDEHLPLNEFSRFLDKAGISYPNELNKYTIATALYSNIISKIRGPAFLRNLPAAQSPLFKLNDDESTVDETLLIIDHRLMADIVNPERNPKIMRQRMIEQLAYRKSDQNNQINEDILNAMKFGLPPCRGIGMGIERLLMLLLNTKDTKEVELFPIF